MQVLQRPYVVRPFLSSSFALARDSRLSVCVDGLVVPSRPNYTIYSLAKTKKRDGECLFLFDRHGIGFESNMYVCTHVVIT